MRWAWVVCALSCLVGCTSDAPSAGDPDAGGNSSSSRPSTTTIVSSDVVPDSSGDSSLDDAATLVPQFIRSQTFESARILGVLESDGACPFLVSDETRRLIIWPTGTTIAGNTVMWMEPASGSVEIGSEVFLGGGIVAVDELQPQIVSGVDECFARIRDSAALSDELVATSGLAG